MSFLKSAKTIIFYFVGLILVLNSINTYVFFFFAENIGCSDFEFTIRCTGHSETMNKFLEILGYIAILNTLMRIPFFFGFILDVIAVAFLFSLFSSIKDRLFMNEEYQ